MKPVKRCGRDMIGVKAGDGMGVGSSRIGDKHLFVFELGTSSKIVGGFNELVLALLVFDLCAFNGSKTGTSMETLGKWYEMGESGAQLV